MTRKAPLPPLLPALAARRYARRRVGLLGGSFNPAHAAHRQISLEALKRLKLDAVWWLVSPQNPLKSPDGMAPLARRLKQAEAVACHPRIHPLALETALGTRYTADTLDALVALFPQTRFVWLMGADNLATIHRWQRWTAIMRTLPVAVLDRPLYSIAAPLGKAARRFGRYRVRQGQAARLASMPPPAWVFLRIPRIPLSATELRARGAGWLVEG